MHRGRMRGERSRRATVDDNGRRRRRRRPAGRGGRRWQDGRIWRKGWRRQRWRQEGEGEGRRQEAEVGRVVARSYERPRERARAWGARGRLGARRAAACCASDRENLGERDVPCAAHARPERPAGPPAGEVRQPPRPWCMWRPPDAGRDTDRAAREEPLFSLIRFKTVAHVHHSSAHSGTPYTACVHTGLLLLILTRTRSQ